MCDLTIRLVGHWRSLGLASCSKLRSIEIEIYFRYDEKPQDVPAYSLAGAGMLSQAPRTLRHVTIRLNYLPRVTTLNNRRMLRLQEFDKVITYDRFPDMKEVNLCILLDRYLEADRKYDWQHVVVGVQKALPNLHARGLLKVIKQSAFG
ncbi:hypothetical protein BD309DRAFT_1030153 [Dichomitus squalens]|uniref:F-box domain-containing protein n=1 Tax=Dichomitus squalens TaxID=114155 RepID=A0A4Q9MFS0_9APHY|nr:hypothetical protein BD311DRAFT_671167 [Dichomitus squalens]TBU43693.1 hypothetical protein BD309DRAFT_1030153 [Dichomitus squalens]TBU63402.1 hypothetical protein BD310DRAFT_1021515 [Dichomitus squalens]